MITSGQIRAARSLLRWTSEDLAVKTGLASRTIKRIEQEDGLPTSRLSTLMGIKRAFEDAGIEFIGTPDDAPGLRLRKKMP